jgi:PKD repeat protein
MRFSPVLTVALGAALLAACGGDSNGPSNSAPTAAFTVSCTQLACAFTDGSTDSDGTIASYAWDFGDSQTSSAKSPEHAFASAGTYTVKLTVIDNGGATDSTTTSVTVPNVPPVANFTFSCSDLVCSFTDQSSDTDGNVASYSWSFGDANSAQNTATTKDANHTFSAGGTYSVQLTVTDNGGATSANTAQVTVTAPSPGGPSASFDVTCTSLDCTVTNTSTNLGSVVTWAWDFGDGQTSTEQDPGPVHYDVTAITTFTITLVVTSDGATSQAQRQVAVIPAATLTCNGVDCTLGLDQAATVVVTLTTSGCQAHGDTFVITAPVVDTLFTDGCYSPVAPAAGSSFTLNGGAAFQAGTQLAAEVLTGVAGATAPQLQVTGSFANGWTLSFDDGFVGPGEPDFNDLVITVRATPQ